LYPAS